MSEIGSKSSATWQDALAYNKSTADTNADGSLVSSDIQSETCQPVECDASQTGSSQVELPTEESIPQQLPICKSLSRSMRIVVTENDPLGAFCNSDSVTPIRQVTGGDVAVGGSVKTLKGESLRNCTPVGSTIFNMSVSDIEFDRVESKKIDEICSASVDSINGTESHSVVVRNRSSTVSAPKNISGQMGLVHKSSSFRSSIHSVTSGVAKKYHDLFASVKNTDGSTRSPHKVPKSVPCEVDSRRASSLGNLLDDDDVKNGSATAKSRQQRSGSLVPLETKETG